MAFKNPAKTFRYTHPDWKTETDPQTEEVKKSYWIVRTDVGDRDRDKIREMASRTVMDDIPEHVRRQAIKNGTINQLIRDHMREEVLMSTRHATLLQLGKGWEGPEFIVPNDFTMIVRDVNTGKEREEPHPLRGQMAPYTIEWIGYQDPDQMDDMMLILNQIWAGRSPEEQKSFREERGGPLSTGDSIEREGEVPVPLAVEPVLEPPGATELQPAGS